MRPTIFTDLDDTLFATRRKIDPAQSEGAEVVSRLRDGLPSGFMTRRQKAFFESLVAMGTVVPVTARSLEAFRRINIGWQSNAVCAHGGVLLTPEGAHCADWHAQMQSLAETHGTSVMLEDAAQLVELTATRLGGYRWRQVDAEAPQLGPLPLYLSVKHSENGEVALRRIKSALEARFGSDLVLALNDNNLAIMPIWLGKEHAVAHLIAKFRAQAPDLPVLGVGDSLSDIGFMHLCDFLITPRGSQIAKILGQPEK